MQRAFRTGMLFVFKALPTLPKVLELWQRLAQEYCQAEIK